MIKVLITSTGFFDTENIVRNFALDQATALKNMGIDVRILCIDLRTVIHSKHIGKKRISVEGIPVYAISLPCRILSETKKSAVGDKLFLSLYKELENEGWIPDIIHAHFVADQMLSTVRYSKKKFVLTEHFSGMNTLSPDKALLARNMPAYELADCRLAVSTAFKDKLERVTGLSFDVMPNVLDSKVFGKKAISRIAHDGIKLVSAGNLTENKNFSTLIEVISLLDRSDIELHIFGSGSKYAELKAKIENLGLSDRVFLRGKVGRESLAEEYMSADGFVLLSKSETFGVAFIEAMACGLPVLSLACGGTGDFINDKNGIIVSQTEASDIAKALGDFIAGLDGYDRERISEEITDRYGYETVMNELIGIYKGLLN